LVRESLRGASCPIHHEERKFTMSAQDNKQATEAAYQAFANGDAAAAMAGMDESIVWTTRGDNALTGTYTGKEEIGGLWAQLAGKGFSIAPKEFLADGDKVVVLTTDTLAGESADSVDVLRFSNEGMVVSFETFGDASIVDRVFPK
jgi:ketosteroid isomerase-like protein